MPRLDELVRRVVTSLPWYDADQVEARHARSDGVHRRSIVLRRKAEAEIGKHPLPVRQSRAYGDLARLGPQRRPR